MWRVIVKWRPRKSCQKGSCCPWLQVVRPGQHFLCWMIYLSTIAKKLHHHIRLNSSFRSDLACWDTFLESFGLFRSPHTVHGQVSTRELCSRPSHIQEHVDSIVVKVLHSVRKKMVTSRIALCPLLRHTVVVLALLTKLSAASQPHIWCYAWL